MSEYTPTGEDFWFYEDPEGKGGDKVHIALFQHVRSVEERQKSISLHALYNAKLAFNRVLPSLKWGSHTISKGSHAPLNLRHENLIANGIDTAKALIGKMRPKATPTPVDADWKIERNAELLDRWLQVVYQQSKVYAKSQFAFFDCCWHPIGALFVGVSETGPYVDRVFPDEIVVDQTECTSDNTTPIQVHRRRLMSKVMLKAMYPKHAKAIDQAGQDGAYTSYRTPGSEQVIVIESWSVALPGQKAGRYAMVIETATLEFEDYTKDYFPFVFMRWNPLPTGFYGRPLAEEGAPFQLRHNEVNEVIQRSQDLMSVPRIFADSRSKLKVEQLDNDIAKVMTYQKHLPSVALWGAVHPELYAQRSENKSAFFEAIGFSRMSAQAKLPEGVRLDSSKALGMASFKQNERFQPQSAMIEDAHLEIAKRLIDLGVDFYKGRDEPSSPEERTIEDQIDWELLGKPGVKYTLQLKPSGLNSLTPAAREEQVNNWARDGWITPQEAKAKSGNPDLEEQTSLWEASVNDIKAVISELDDGETPQPDHLQNLVFGLPYVHMTYLKRKRQKNMDQETLQRYRDWLAEAEAVLEGSQAQPDFSDPAVAQEQALQSAQQLDAPVGPDGVPLSAMAIQ